MAMKEVELRSVAAFASTEQAVKEYQSKPYTPELVTMFYRTIWQTQEELVGQTYEVSPCPYTQEELTALEKQGRRVGYLPAELATQQSRHLLGKMFPQMKSHSFQEDNSVTNDKNSSGWFDYEAGIDAPYLNIDEKQLEEKAVEEKRKLLSSNQYIVAGQDNKFLTGQYLDKRATYLRLGSRDGGRVVSAGFNRYGRLFVGWHLKSGYRGRGLRGRSSGVKKS